MLRRGLRNGCGAPTVSRFRRPPHAPDGYRDPPGTTGLGRQTRLPAGRTANHSRPVLLRGTLQGRSLHARHPDVRRLPAGNGVLHDGFRADAGTRWLALRTGARVDLSVTVPQPGCARIEVVGLRALRR